MSTSNSNLAAAVRPTNHIKWPQWLRRGPMEMAACALITLGLLMLLQPFFLVLFTWSFATMLAGTVMFMIVSKFPQ